MWADIGVSAGIGDLSASGNQSGSTLGAGVGRHGGIQLTFRKDLDPDIPWYNPLKYIDGMSVGLGLGIGLPLSLTKPLQKCESLEH